MDDYQPTSWGQVRPPVKHIDLDSNWTRLLPPNSLEITAVGYGSSYWSASGKVDVHFADEPSKSYFIKIARDDTRPAKQMMEGEYESLRQLHQFAPDMVPEPIGFGTYEADPSVHFLLCEFIELEDEEAPDIVAFTRGLAEMHKRSIESGPSSGFGFPVVTCDEILRQHTKWSHSWEEFFIEHLKQAVRLEEEVHGPSPELAVMLPDLYEKVCPRLLRPLETEGRELKPCLVHGDLWDGNVASGRSDGRPYMFDASSLWAHNEYDLHKFRGDRYRFGKMHVQEYFHWFPISTPQNDWPHRHQLYSLIADLHSSALFPGTTEFRKVLIESVRELIKDFPNGYTGSERRKGS